jgi:Flp pilus assembly protein TadB
MDPVMMGDTWSHPIGKIMYIAAFVSEIIGIFAFRALIRIHI